MDTDSRGSQSERSTIVPSSWYTVMVPTISRYSFTNARNLHEFFTSPPTTTDAILHYWVLEKHIVTSYYELSNTSKWISLLLFTGTRTWAVSDLFNCHPILEGLMDLLFLCHRAVAWPLRSTAGKCRSRIWIDFSTTREKQRGRNRNSESEKVHIEQHS